MRGGEGRVNTTTLFEVKGGMPASRERSSMTVGKGRRRQAARNQPTAKNSSPSKRIMSNVFERCEWDCASITVEKHQRRQPTNREEQPSQQGNTIKLRLCSRWKHHHHRPRCD